MSGVSLKPNDNYPLLPLSINVSASGQSALIAAVAQPPQFFNIYKLFLVVATATNIKFQDGNTDLCAAMSLAANGAITLDLDGTPWFTTSIGNAFNINSSAAVQISGTLYYTQNLHK